MRWRGRIAIAGGAAVALWLGGLIVGDAALEPGVRDRVASRIAESLQAQATVADGDLALVRGGFDLDGLAARRDDAVGHLALAVARLDCELAPLGAALIDRHCRALGLAGLRLEVSTTQMFRLAHPKRPPLRAEQLAIFDARLELAAGAIAPGLGRVTIAVERAEAGETVFKTPLSWLLALHQLRATIELPPESGGMTLRLAYQAGELQVSGGVFGPAPIALAIALPLADPAEEPRAETARLIAFGKDVAERLIARKAAAWLRAALRR